MRPQISWMISPENRSGMEQKETKCMKPKISTAHQVSVLMHQRRGPTRSPGVRFVAFGKPNFGFWPARD